MPRFARHIRRERSTRRSLRTSGSAQHEEDAATKIIAAL
jgi:hypothetical protein